MDIAYTEIIYRIKKSRKKLSHKSRNVYKSVFL